MHRPSYYERQPVYDLHETNPVKFEEVYTKARADKIKMADFIEICKDVLKTL